MQPFDDVAWRQLMHFVDADDGAGLAALLAASLETPPRILSQSDPADELGRTPLMLAYWRGKAGAAAAIVNAGASYQQQDTSGRNASWYARRFGKGASEGKMSRAIRASFRRMSMEDAISTELQSSAAEQVSAPPGKRRPRDL